MTKPVVHKRERNARREQQRQQAPPPHPSYGVPRFAGLPNELQDMIWDLSIEPRGMTIIAQMDHTQHPPALRWYSPNPMLPQLWATGAARRRALTFLTCVIDNIVPGSQVIYFDPRRDIIQLRDHLVPHRMTATTALVRFQFAQIRKLAIVPPVDTLGNLNIPLYHPVLEKLYVLWTATPNVIQVYGQSPLGFRVVFLYGRYGNDWADARARLAEYVQDVNHILATAGTGRTAILGVGLVAMIPMG